MEKKILKTSAERLQFARKRKGLTQEELAEITGYSGPGIITKYETGVREMGWKAAARIAPALEVSAEWLLCLTDEMQSLASIDWIDLRKEDDGYYNLIRALTGDPFNYTFLFSCKAKYSGQNHNVPLHDITWLSRSSAVCNWWDSDHKGHEGEVISVKITSREKSFSIPYAWFASSITVMAYQMQAAINNSFSAWETYNNF